jgi:hypothetical protein
LRYPFTMFGLCSLGAFLLMGCLDASIDTTSLGRTLNAVIRVMIFPLWLIRTFTFIIVVWLFGGNPENLPEWVSYATMPVLIFPYLVMDIILAHWLRESLRE